MSSREALESVARLMATSNIELRALPDELKCAKCRSVLKDACQMPCDCRFCRACIHDMMASGHQFCPGGLQQCAGTPLSTAAPDYRANNSIMRLTAGCPRAGCSHECPLVDMETHLRACSRGNIECPFRALGCVQGALPGEEMSGHLLQESRSHSEILIGLVANINREVEVLKRELALRDEQGRHVENEMKLIINENKSIKSDVKLLKEEIESITFENKIIKEELKSIKDETESLKEKNKFISFENEPIKGERGALCERVRLSAENLEWESDERANAGISEVTEAVASNQDALGTLMEPVGDEIGPIKEQLDSMGCRVESIEVPVGLAQLDDWVIDEDLSKTEWYGWGSATAKTSDKFTGGERPHTYQLACYNRLDRNEFNIFLRIWAGPTDDQLEWPFRGAVTITVASTDRPKACSETQQCEINRPIDNRCSWHMNDITFEHAELRGAGLDLERGVRVSCRVKPGAGQ